MKLYFLWLVLVGLTTVPVATVSTNAVSTCTVHEHVVYNDMYDKNVVHVQYNEMYNTIMLILKTFDNQKKCTSCFFVFF